MTTPSLTFASSFTSPTCEIPQFVHLDCSSSVSCANVTFPGLWNWYVSCILAGSFDDDDDDDARILKFVFLVLLTSDDTCCCSCRRRRRKHAEYVVLNDVEAAANMSSSFVFRGGAAELVRSLLQRVTTFWLQHTLRVLFFLKFRVLIKCGFLIS